MKRITRRSSTNPFLAWTDLAWKVGEMSLASAQVIAHRTTRMAAAGPKPNARDQREFALMGQEKFDAATESAHAIGVQLMNMNLRFGAQVVRQMMTGSAAMVSLASSRDVGQLVRRQAKLVQAASRSAATAAEISRSTVRLAANGLKPIHTRATANARRLGKR
ncbi:MAG: polyhydroxyalkanoate granule-associated phasin [Casimicrobiaceae bacterium]